ncbi:hypothetical protein D9758_005678 [Tetrapyrgos nigripes]|uniref:Association with the SNF1 complex (ASC) domain-containing protein n=1 Tax=Tetrapyrgos nigripes TaxID=182062 RepID=A0A8H5GK05_9AGAR|nr:hypothetical protein D9758_005678 [Tetrapyrgos nigripes]
MCSFVRDPTSSTFSTIIPLLPGTHHLRFLVDDQWRVADDLPTAVDDQGSLANYVAVGAVITGVITPPEAPSSPSPLGKKPTHRTVNSNAAAGLKLTGLDNPAALGEGLRRYKMGHSFWSASSTIDGDEDIHPSPQEQPMSPGTPSAYGFPASVPVKQKPRKPSGSRYTPRWTNEIPLELIEAAAEEEAYLNYQTRLQQQMFAQQQYNAYGHGYSNPSRPPVQISGFVPLPNIPPAPSLPRYLDKLILNAHVQAKTGVGVSVGSTMAATGGSFSSSSQRGGRERVRSPVRDRDREREVANRDRDRDRDREARRRERERRSFGMSAEETLSRNTDGGSLLEESPTPTLVSSVAAGGGSGSGSTSPTSPTHVKSDKPNGIVFDDTVVADDNSVLPVPSHVVLHHLCTSAIRNGVLAVGETYVTSVYYKPAA